jgi:hypothetical protein
LRFAQRRSARLLALLLTLTMLAAACGDDGDAGDAAPGTDSGSGELSGDIVISGSSTVEPISIDVAGKFGEIAPDVKVAVSGPGTGDGFQAFCSGETDISDASRAIKPEEMEACEANGVEFVEMKVAIDGIAVLTSPDGEGISECLSFGDMYALVGPESQGFEQWSQANDLARTVEVDRRQTESRRCGLERPLGSCPSCLSDRIVQRLLEGHTPFSHALSDKRLGVGVQRHCRPHDVIIASVNLTA